MVCSGPSIKEQGNYYGKQNYLPQDLKSSATYEVNRKQYVVIDCGGGKLGTTSGDSYVAFDLPSSK